MTDRRSVTASCHCGAVVIEVEHRPETLTECNCSLCRRYGVRWVRYTCKTARVVSGEETLQGYRWGDEMIDFYHCRVCGCVTHYEVTEKTGDWSISVNSRLMAPEDVKGLAVRLFDGADSWKFIERDSLP